MTRHTLDTVAAELPFHLDDTSQVNAAFVRWQQSRNDDDKQLVDLWTYCYVYRYFLIKLAPSDAHTPLTFDRLVANAFADVQEHLGSIREPGHYTGWVGTICRNTFVNYLRTRHTVVSLDGGLPALAVEDPVPTKVHDTFIVHQTVCAAIEALPAYMREVARMRLLEDRSYAAISIETGKTRETLRAYVGKALVLLRRSAALQTLFTEMLD